MFGCHVVFVVGEAEGGKLSRGGMRFSRHGSIGVAVLLRDPRGPGLCLHEAVACDQKERSFAGSVWAREMARAWRDYARLSAEG